MIFRSTDHTRPGPADRAQRLNPPHPARDDRRVEQAIAPAKFPRGSFMLSPPFRWTPAFRRGHLFWTNPNNPDSF